MNLPAARAAGFLDSLGVNIHLVDSNTYGNSSRLISELEFLGVDRVRDFNPNNWDLPSFEALAAQGVKLDLVIGHNPDEELGGGGLQSDLALIDQIAQSSPGSIMGLEGLNEPSNFPNYLNGQPTSDWTTVLSVQKLEYTLVKSDPMFRNVPLLNASVWPASFAGAVPNFGSYADLGNAHVYPYSGNQPGSSVSQGLSEQGQIVPGKPAWVTEFGYSTTPGDPTYGVDATTQAKNLLNGLADTFKAGVPYTFIYQLADEAANIPSNEAWGALGLFNFDGTAKPAATALHNLTTILKDAGSTAMTFTPGSLNVSISGLPSTGNSLLFEKSNGTFDLLIWNEVPDWNPSTASDVSVSPVPVTATVNGVSVNAGVFDPLTGTSPISTQSNATTIHLAVSDHPLLVQMSPVITPAMDTLEIRTSEDAYKGDAQFTVTVDGQKVGGTYAAHALHSAGADESLLLSGNWGTGKHTIGITFLNDLYAGSATTDRNLYVDQILYDGRPASGSPLTLLSNGTGTLLSDGLGSSTSGKSLTLNLSEDAYQGDAQFSLALDGKTLDTPEIVSTLHSSGKSEAFSFTVNGGSGAHDLAVTFGNDAYGGKPTADRNLYVNSIAAGSTTIQPNLEISRNGTQHFSISF